MAVRYCSSVGLVLYNHGLKVVQSSTQGCTIIHMTLGNLPNKRLGVIAEVLGVIEKGLGVIAETLRDYSGRP